MKKFAALILSIITLSTAMSVNAAGIPRASAPENATEEQIVIVENLIGDILDEVAAGNVGYTEAAGYANTRVRKAVVAGETSGHGYGILSPIAQNAIRYYRDIYLRPDYYAETENTVRALIADLIIEVESGADYETVKEKAYTRIYQSANPSYNPEIDGVGDFCYWDIPSVDSVMLMQARELLKNAMN
jgi:hypothetical protein